MFFNPCCCNLDVVGWFMTTLVAKQPKPARISLFSSMPARVCPNQDLPIFAIIGTVIQSLTNFLNFVFVFVLYLYLYLCCICRRPLTLATGELEHLRSRHRERQSLQWSEAFPAVNININWQKKSLTF